MSEPWVKSADGGCVLTLRVIPRARRTGVVGPHGDALKVRLKAPPVDGKANAALLAFLAGTLACATGQVQLVGGATSRTKRVFVANRTPTQVEAALRL